MCFRALILVYGTCPHACLIVLESTMCAVCTQIVSEAASVAVAPIHGIPNLLVNPKVRN